MSILSILNFMTESHVHEINKDFNLPHYKNTFSLDIKFCSWRIGHMRVNNKAATKRGWEMSSKYSNMNY